MRLRALAERPVNLLRINILQSSIKNELVTIGTKVNSQFLAQEDECEDRTVETCGFGVESQRVGAICKVKLSVVDHRERNRIMQECDRCFDGIESQWRVERAEVVASL